MLVVPQAHQALLGRPAIEALELLQRVDAVQEQENACTRDQAAVSTVVPGLGKARRGIQDPLARRCQAIRSHYSKKNSSPFTPEGEG